jgi:DNA integrity scanning protein DisA with diadenylate cyclase activity
MERCRLNRELKNSEDVQDALIEDYFRYNDLSRMEADDILMNIFEIEHFQLQQTTDISRDFSLRLSKRLADSDLAVIGLTGIEPIRKISVLDWVLPVLA